MYKNKLVYNLFRIFLIALTKAFPKNLQLINYVDLLQYKRLRYIYTLKGVRLGENSILYSVTVSQSKKGDEFYIGDNSVLTGCTLLGHDASPALFLPELQNHKEVYKRGSRRSYIDPIRIGSNVFIGVGAIVLPGVSIGDNVIIAAGSVVTKDVPSGKVAAGNPAVIVKETSQVIEKYKGIYSNHKERF